MALSHAVMRGRWLHTGNFRMPATPVSVVTGLVSDPHLEPWGRRRCASSCYYVAPTRNLLPWPLDGGGKTKIRKGSNHVRILDRYI